MSNRTGNSERRARVPILSILRAKTAGRFRAKLRQEGDCLVFTGTKNRRGYGFVDVTYGNIGERYPILTHRLAWALHYGEDPDPALIVCHKCNNPKCCNVEHLYLGTHRDNTDDMARAGTGRPGKGMRGRKGADHPRAHSQARRDEVMALIDADMAAGKGLNFKDIERRTGVARQTAKRWWQAAQP